MDTFRIGHRPLHFWNVHAALSALSITAITIYHSPDCSSRIHPSTPQTQLHTYKKHLCRTRRTAASTAYDPRTCSITQRHRRCRIRRWSITSGQSPDPINRPSRSGNVALLSIHRAWLISLYVLNLPATQINIPETKRSKRCASSVCRVRWMSWLSV
jgi:hypothetical protein